MVKHTYFSVELSILKHPVITVVNKRRKEPNYGQELAFQSKRTMTIKTSRKGRQARWIEIKIITFLCTQEHTRLQSRHIVVTVVRYQDSRNWNQLHTSLSYTTITKPDAIYPTTGEASSIPSRKEIIATSLL